MTLPARQQRTSVLLPLAMKVASPPQLLAVKEHQTLLLDPYMLMGRHQDIAVDAIAVAAAAVAVAAAMLGCMPEPGPGSERRLFGVVDSAVAADIAVVAADGGAELAVAVADPSILAAAAGAH